MGYIYTKDALPPSSLQFIHLFHCGDPCPYLSINKNKLLHQSLQWVIAYFEDAAEDVTVQFTIYKVLVMDEV